MSYTREYEDGKDTVIFLTKDDQQELMGNENTVLEDEEEEMSGAIKANGEIDWDCPCLKGMAYGMARSSDERPCGSEFREAFSCFVKSEAEPKGLDCVDAFESMQKCMASHPEHYGTRGDDEDGDDNEDFEEESEGSSEAKAK